MSPTLKFLLLITGLLFAAGCTAIHRFDSTKHEVIPVSPGLEPSRLENLHQRIAKGEPAIFKVAQGEKLPFKLAIDLPIGALEESDYVFHFKQDTYFLLSQKYLRVSPDGQRWANVTSPKSLAKLFGFKHGNVSFGFATTTNKVPSMNVDIRVK